MIKLRSLPLLLLASACLFPAFTQGQGVAPAVRIVSRIDESHLVTLKGNTNPHANAANDMGAVGPDFAMPDLTLVLSRSAAQEAAFEQFIKDQYDSSSPNYHRWLTPAQIGEQYGPAMGDIATITSWLSSHGFAIKSVAPDRMTIRFGGTGGQIQSAFHTSIHKLLVNGVPHIGNMTDPQIPAALAPVVVGVKALHNFLPHPMHRDAGKVQFNRTTGHWQRLAGTSITASTAGSASTPPSATIPPSASTTPGASTSAAGVRPELGINVPGTSTTNAYLEEDVTPWDFATIYNVTPAWNAGYTGSGQAIAIAGTSLISQSNVGSDSYSGSGTVRSINGSDVSTFRSSFGLPALSSFEQIDTGDGGTSATECTSTSSTAVCGIGDLDENSLDVEWSGAVATGSPIVLVVTGQNQAGTVDTVYDSAQYVVENHIASILNVSYGLCELAQGTAQNVAFYNLWQSAAAEGIAVFVAAGDSGSPACDQGGDYIGWPYSAQYGLSVSGLASTPYDVAVGGTDFSWCKPTINSAGNTVGCPSSNTGASPYWNTSSTNAGNSSTGQSAVGYIPEIPWNDTCLNPILATYLDSILSYEGYSGGANPEATCNAIQNDWQSIYSGSGSYYSSGNGPMLAPYIDTIGGSGGASNCVANTTSTSSTSNGTCQASSSTTGTANGSIPLYNDGWVKPTWQASAQGTVGVPNDGVRDLPDVSFFAADGYLNSAYLACISANGACTYPDNTEEVYEEFGGTSIASPEMAGVMALINQKVGSPQGLPLAELYNLAGQQNYSDCSSETVTNSNTNCYFHSIDQGTNSMPCDLGASVGGVNYSNGWVTSQAYTGINSPNCTALNSGDTVGTLTSTSVKSSANSNGVAYKAIAGYNMATGLGSLNVSNVVNGWSGFSIGTAVSTLNVSLSATTITASQTVTVTVNVTPSGSSGSSAATPTGTIVVTGGGYNSNQTLTSGSATFTIPANSLSPGAVTLTIYYSGDSTYASLTTTQKVTVSAVTPTVTVTAPLNDNIANAVPVSVTVSGPAGAQAPTGTVTLSSGSYNSTAVALSSAGLASFTIPAGVLPSGQNTLTANYSGTSTYYSGATGTTTITIVSASTLSPTVTVTPTPSSIDSSQSLTVTINVTGSSSAPTGTVMLTATGGYSSGQIALVGGSAKITILGNTLGAGTITLKAAYSGDAVYAVGSGSSSVTVAASTYSLAATTPAAVSPGSSATSTITGKASTTNYTGTVTMASCSLTSSPSGAVSLPACSVSGTITYTDGAASGSGTATVSTTAASVGAMVRPKLPGDKGWFNAGSGAILALLVFFGIPARRRSWRNMLVVLVSLVILGGMAACGSGLGGTMGNGNGNGNGTGTSATTAGTYTFTVQGTGNDPASTQETTTFTVTVN